MCTTFTLAKLNHSGQLPQQKKYLPPTSDYIGHIYYTPPNLCGLYHNKMKIWHKKEKQCGRAHRTHTYDLETPRVSKIASCAWLKVGEFFSETTGFMIAVQVEVISTSGYKKYILNTHNNTNDICRKYWEKWETIQHVIGAYHALAHGSYTHRHNQVDNIIHL